MKHCIYILIFFTALLNDDLIAQNRTFISPGIKLGYAFGSNGGLIAGLEVSYTKFPDNRGLITGVCLSIEQLHYSTLFIHVAFEAASIIGASIGPTLMISKQHNAFGVAGTVFGGLVILPYYRYTYLPNDLDFGEAGSFLKFPIQLSGSDFTE